MKEEIVKFSRHAIQQMFARSISKENVKHVIRNGITVINYPDDKPYPSKLMLGFVNERPLHVVLANVKIEKTVIVITAYEPDKNIWQDDFRKRRKI